jgi:hypothetical protein
MKFFKALFKLAANLAKEDRKVFVTENYSQVEESEPEVEQPKVEVQSHQEEEKEEVVTIHNQELSDIRNWAVKKIELLHEADRHRNARALAAEFDEWINIPDDADEIEYISIDNNDWTDDQEIDVR